MTTISANLVGAMVRNAREGGASPPVKRVPIARPHHFLSADWVRMTSDEWRSRRIDRLSVVLARSERKRVKAVMFR